MKSLGGVICCFKVEPFEIGLVEARDVVEAFDLAPNCKEEVLGVKLGRLDSSGIRWPDRRGVGE